MVDGCDPRRSDRCSDDRVCRAFTHFDWICGARDRLVPDEVEALSEEAIIDELAQLAHLLASNLTTKFVYVNLSLATLIGAILTAIAAVLLA